MAQRRMFSQRIVGSDQFLDMPPSAQNLYFHLGMYADDDGFVSPQKVIRMVGAMADDLKLLIAKQFVIPFESGVIVVSHWRENNYIQSDRYRETIYTHEKQKLSCIQNVYKMDTQVRLELGKVRIGQSRSSESTGFTQFWEKYPRKVKKKEAEKAWAKLSPSKELLSEILTAVAAQSSSEEWRKEAGRFVPHPSTWLNGARWQDEVTKPAPRFIQLPN